MHASSACAPISFTRPTYPTLVPLTLGRIGHPCTENVYSYLVFRVIRASPLCHPERRRSKRDGKSKDPYPLNPARSPQGALPLRLSMLVGGTTQKTEPLYLKTLLN